MCCTFLDEVMSQSELTTHCILTPLRAFDALPWDAKLMKTMKERSQKFDFVLAIALSVTCNSGYYHKK